MIKLSPSRNALHIAQQYLKHEFRKVFSDVKSPVIWERLDKSLENFIKRENEESLWELVAAISEGWRMKDVYYFLSSTKYQWKLKEIPFSKVVLTGMSPIIDKYTIKKFNRDPLKFAKAWQKDKKMRQEILKAGISAYKQRDHFPILVFQADDGFRVFDGMRRVLLAIIKGQNKIKAWVGYKINPRGKSLISGAQCRSLQNIYQRSKRKDKELANAVVQIGKEVITQYRNGKEILVKRIAGWSHNPEVKRIFKKMIK